MEVLHRSDRLLHRRRGAHATLCRRLSTVFLLGSALLAPGCGNSPGKSPAATDSKKSPAQSQRLESLPSKSDEFVGSGACGACHGPEVQAFHSHPMSRSMARSRDAVPIEDFEHVSFSPFDSISYYVERTSQGLIHHEKRLDASGEVIYDQGLPVEFTVGSGSKGRSYLLNDGGRMYASPISWYTSPHKWNLSPGYAADHNPRFERRISDGCLACHAGRIAPRGDKHDCDRFAEQPVQESSIGCERCHGPGRGHIAFQSTTGDRSRDRDPIVNPAKLEGAKRDAVCNQCHLQGRRRVVRSGRSEFDFQPGSFLSDNWVIFLKTAGVKQGTAAAVSQVEQMYASRCYLQSRGALACITCHDGHRAPRGAEGELAYREKCLTCHSRQATNCSVEAAERTRVTATDSCVACHMPKFAAADVHATQTDHRVLRKPEPAVPRESGGEPPVEQQFRNAEMVLFTEPGCQIDSAEWDRARGIFFAEQAAAGGTDKQARTAIELLRPIMNGSLDDGDTEARLLLGRAYSRLGLVPQMLRAWEQVLAIQPRHEVVLDELATHYHEMNDLPTARRYYERLVEVNPGRSQYFGRLAHVLGQLNELPKAIAAAERCLQLNPTLVQSHSWLAEAYRAIGNTEKAAYHEGKLKQFQSLAIQKP